jgi:broad specificity phosphatase PhoE
MTENTFGMQTAKVINDLHLRDIQNYVVLLRHSARHYGTAENDESMGLTEEGKQTSSEFGRALPSNSSFRFFSSPVNRCVETSDFIEKGCSSTSKKTQTNTVMDELFPFFVKDMSKIMQMAYKLAVAGDYPKFFRDWFDNNIQADLIEDASQSAQRLLSVLVGLLQKPSEFNGNICTTHDWHLVLLKEYYLGQKAEEHGNIDYLEGIIIYKQDDNYYIINHQSEASLLKVL